MNITTLNKSTEIAQNVLNMSINLRGMGAKVEYFDRDQFFTDLLGAEGQVTFNPEVTIDIALDFQNVAREDRKIISHGYQIANYGSKEEHAYKFYLNMADSLISRLTSEDLLRNEVPELVKEYITELGDPKYAVESVVKLANSLKSPKLSKLFVKVFGEQNEVVKWYTTKCPKQIDKGVLSDWTVTLSVLPHHIAGMSYYGSLNHGGDRWRDGYEGTSCMDTKRNGRGQGVNHLIPSLRDITMAVAYLSEATDTDIWNPVYQARCLVRVVHVNGEAHMIICRTYSTGNNTKHILQEGLKNQFKNVHEVNNMRKFSRSKVHEVTVDYPSDITFSFEDEKITCVECSGSGGQSFNTCEHCGGLGSWSVEGGDFLPYIDDSEFFSVSDTQMRFKLPIAYFESIGVTLVDEEVITAEEAKREEGLVGGLVDLIAVDTEAAQEVQVLPLDDEFFTDEETVADAVPALGFVDAEEIAIEDRRARDRHIHEVDYAVMEERILRGLGNLARNHFNQGVAAHGEIERHPMMRADLQRINGGFMRFDRDREERLVAEEVQFNQADIYRLLGFANWEPPVAQPRVRFIDREPVFRVHNDIHRGVEA